MKRKSRHIEPAVKSYFFGEGYIELGETIASAWRKNGSKIAHSALAIKYIWGSEFINAYQAVCLTIFKFFILISVAVFGSLFTAVFSCIHVSILAVMMALVYFGFILLRTVDTIYCLIKGLGTNCYNPGCERKFTLPIYVCPKCHALHYRLRPSKYGIFKRKCTCGHKLPTTFINGRQKLDSLCPHCNCKAIKGIHKSLLIPVVGGANAGKTCFISMAIDKIQEEAPNMKLDFQYQYVQGDQYDDNIKRMKKGTCPQKTNDMAFKYYNFYLTPHGQKVNHLISVCDIAGEVFANQDIMARQQGYRFADALVVIVDPLSITEYKNELKKTMKPEEFAQLNASTQQMSDVLSGLINTMESLYHVKATDKIKKSVVIVFTKCDIPGLSEKIGPQAVNDYIQSHGSTAHTDASNAVCKQFLLEYGEDNFLNTVSSKFSQVQFFACSALGHNTAGKSFTPVDVDKPLLWIIDKMNRSLDLNKLWGKSI